MTTAANPQSYPNSGWQNPNWQNTGGPTPPWGSNQAWLQPPFWHPAGMSRPVAIAATVLGFALFWPIGLAMLVFLLASGRLGCRRRRWAQGPDGANQYDWHPITPPWANWCGGGGPSKPRSSGNHAFDDYRAETLRRLEEEQAEFSGFLDRLRFAKDKAEFDQFMADRRQPPAPPPAPPQGSNDPTHG